MTLALSCRREWSVHGPGLRRVALRAGVAPASAVLQHRVLRAHARREQAPKHQGSRGCTAVCLSVQRPVFKTKLRWHLGVGRC